MKQEKLPTFGFWVFILQVARKDEYDTHTAPRAFIDTPYNEDILVTPSSKPILSLVNSIPERNGPNSTYPILALFVTIWEEVLSLSRQEAWYNTNCTNQGGTHCQTSIVDCYVTVVKVQGTVPAKILTVTRRKDLLADASFTSFCFIGKYC
jgi:hypothetical protein